MSQFTHLSEDKEVVEQAEIIQKQVDEIFELARTNNWDFQQFAKKILAGAAENDLGYFAIAAQLVQHVTNLKGIKAIQLLKFLLVQVKNLDTVSIKKTQEMFVHGLIINKLKAALAYQEQEKQKQKQKQPQEQKQKQKRKSLGRIENEKL
jgi:hypothetical protein